VCGDALVDALRARINTLALGARLPTLYPNREYLQAGGLMSYGPSFSDLFLRAADYVDKILRGAKPGDLPVEQPTKFELVINLTAAKALDVGLHPPDVGDLDNLFGSGDPSKGSVRLRSDQWFALACVGICGRGVVHGNHAEGICVAKEQRTERGLTDANSVRENGLEYRPQVTGRTRNDAQHLGGCRLLLQRLGKVVARLGELTGARFELLFQLDQ
jgi:hypothetical protein